MRHLNPILLVFVLMLVPLVGSAQDEPLWRSVAEAHGFEAWKEVGHVEFTWTHAGSGTSRSYVWDRRAHRVKVTMGDETFDISSWGLDLADDRERAAHKAFVNDSYWLAFEFKAVTDDVERTELPNADSPFGGTAPAYRVEYPPDVGYTPGDAYVVHVGADGRSIGWSYYPSGSKLPKMSTLRGGVVEQMGVALPTRFETPDGELVIEISDLKLSR